MTGQGIDMDYPDIEWFALETNRGHCVVFEIASKYCISDSVDYDDYSISSKWFLPIAATAKSLQSCPILCNPIDGSPPGSSVPGVLQTRTVEWVAIFFSNACIHAKSLQSCLTLCNPMDSSPSGSSVPGILQTRTLEWVVIFFSNACMHAKSLQWCLTLCNPMDSSPTGSSVHRIF